MQRHDSIESSYHMVAPVRAADARESNGVAGSGAEIRDRRGGAEAMAKGPREEELARGGSARMSMWPTGNSIKNKMKKTPPVSKY